MDNPAPFHTWCKKQLASERDIVVVIDAGHGGEDPGSIGSGGSYEKDVPWGISKYLEASLNMSPGMKQ